MSSLFDQLQSPNNDDTTVSVSVSMDNWLPIASLVILCCLIICLIVKCSSTPSGGLYSVCSGVAYFFVILLILLIVIAVYNKYYVKCDTCGNDNEEEFSNYQWGDDGFTLADWDNKDCRTHQIIGPSPNKKSLHTWQYNPQNTLVDYRFYTTHNNNTTQIEPITRPEVGVYSGLPTVHVNDALGTLSTRNPDVNGSHTQYVLQHPASVVPINKPVLHYNY